MLQDLPQQVGQLTKLKMLSLAGEARRGCMVGLLLHHQTKPAAVTAVQVHAVQLAAGFCPGSAAATFCYAFLI
jgi:hypothetical protein